MAVEVADGSVIGTFATGLSSEVFTVSEALRFSADCNSVFVADTLTNSSFRSGGMQFSGVDIMKSDDWPKNLRDAKQCGNLHLLEPMQRHSVDPNGRGEWPGYLESEAQWQKSECRPFRIQILQSGIGSDKF